MTKINQEEYEILKELDDKWKWIAKDKYSDNPELFQVKPYKTGVVWFWVGYTEVEKIYNDELFQFIQWEDEEPHNIQELIDEYLDDEYGYFNMKLSREFEEFIKKESGEAEMKKDIKWLMQWIEEYESEVIEECKDELKGIVRAHSHGKQSAIKRIKQKIDQLDEPEVLSKEWIGEHTWNNHYIGRPFVYVDDLQNLLVPKQEEVDRAYKDGYEEGREHGFYKGYREGLVNKWGEPETVADVVTTFWKSYERLKEVMNMEVEELEE